MEQIHTFGASTRDVRLRRQAALHGVMASMKELCAGLALAITLVPASASERSSVHTRAFQREHPCPSTGERRGRCPGFVIDHVRPLCAGGSDSPANMQWQSTADGKRKDAQEMRECRALRTARP